MKLTNENYHSKEANQHHLSYSQFKDFCGCLGKVGCEAMAMAKINGDWQCKTSNAMLVGSYVDAHFEGSLDLFQAKNPDIFTAKGFLKSEFKKAEEIIERVSKDDLFMQFMSGEKQTIMTAELFGVKWKIKIDSYHPEKAIVDLKVMKNLREGFYVKDFGRVNFIDFWGYDQQMAIYQEVVRINTGNQLRCYIAAVDKTEFSDIEILQIDQNRLNDTLSLIEASVKRVIEVKAGAKPDRCGTCDYCKSTKVLTSPIHYSELILSI